MEEKGFRSSSLRSVFSILSFILIYLTLASTLLAADTKVKYKGATKCKGMKLSVSFTYDEAQHIIENVKTEARCINATGGMSWTTEKKTIRVSSSDKFEYESDGTSFSGKIGQDGKAEGEFNPGISSVICFDKEPIAVSVCTKWKAIPCK